MFFCNCYKESNKHYPHNFEVKNEFWLFQYFCAHGVNFCENFSWKEIVSHNQTQSLKFYSWKGLNILTKWCWRWQSGWIILRSLICGGFNPWQAYFYVCEGASLLYVCTCVKVVPKVEVQGERERVREPLIMLHFLHKCDQLNSGFNLN